MQPGLDRMPVPSANQGRNGPPEARIPAPAGPLWAWAWGREVPPYGPPWTPGLYNLALASSCQPTFKSFPGRAAFLLLVIALEEQSSLFKGGPGTS